MYNFYKTFTFFFNFIINALRELFGNTPLLNEINQKDKKIYVKLKTEKEKKKCILKLRLRMIPTFFNKRFTLSNVFLNARDVSNSVEVLLSTASAREERSFNTMLSFFCCRSCRNFLSSVLKSSILLSFLAEYSEMARAKYFFVDAVPEY